MEVPAAYGMYSAPELDGIVDEIYSTEQSTDWMYPNQLVAYGGPCDFTAVFHLCYDLDNLYMIAILTDDVEEDYDITYSEPWMFDNVEIFLQLDTNTTYINYDNLTEQFRVCRGYGLETYGFTPWGYYIESSPTGWIFEVAIPWTAAANEGILPEDITVYLDDAVGFDFHGADSDNTDGDPTIGNRDYQTAWDLDGQDGTEDQAWHNVTVFGYLTFEGFGNDALAVFHESDIKIFPNPGNNSLTFEIEGSQPYKIYSINGTKVLAGETTGTVDISSLKSGLYIAQLGDESVRFVKE
jgi:hypothetical protein